MRMRMRMRMRKRRRSSRRRIRRRRTLRAFLYVSRDVSRCFCCRWRAKNTAKSACER